jgi:hypothetical protein
MRHTPYKLSDSFQLHIIQDFEFDEPKKEMLYKSKYVAVAILVVEFVNGLLIVSACNSCSSYQTLQMFLPVESCRNEELPSFSAVRFCGCRHTALVVSNLCDHHNIPNEYDIFLKHSHLIKHLKTAGNPVRPGWQNLGANILTFRKHLLGCYLTPEYYLHCFNVSKQNDILILLCNTCNRRNCSHSRVAAQDEFTDTPPIVAVSESYSKAYRHTLYSTLKYPYDYGGFHDESEFGSCTEGLNDIIRLRSKKGSSFFSVKFSNLTIIEPIENMKCCLSSDIRVHKSYSILIFTPAELIEEFETQTYRCEVCNTIFHIDGHESGLLNYSDHYFFCVEMFYSLLDLTC